MSIMIELLQGGIGLALGALGGAGAVALVAFSRHDQLRTDLDNADADAADLRASLTQHRNQLMFAGAGKLPALPKRRRAAAQPDKAASPFDTLGRAG
jgi:hypothetical protein